MQQLKGNKNPTTGLYYRNPTHIDEAEYARTQAEIVVAVAQSGMKIKEVTLENYLDEGESMGDAGYGNPLSGVRKIRDMEEEEAKAFMATVMKFKPDMLTLQMSLGEYASTKKISNAKISALNLTTGGLWPTELGERIGELMCDRRLNIVFFEYAVVFGPQGARFQVEFYGTDDESYEDNTLFDPKIYVKYQSQK